VPKFVADSVETTGLKWVAASSGALTKIASATFTSQASVAVDSVFDSTYSTYLINISAFAATGADDLQLQFRYSGTTQTTDYYGSGFGYKRDNSIVTYGFSNTAAATLTTNSGAIQGASLLQLVVGNVGVSADPRYFGKGFCTDLDQGIISFAGTNFTTRTYTGFLLKSSSTNITGYYEVYGMAK
jgi:hypothetical protein